MHYKLVSDLDAAPWPVMDALEDIRTVNGTFGRSCLMKLLTYMYQ